MKRTLSFLLSLIIVIGIITSVPVTVSAASIDDLTFELNDDGESYSVVACDEGASGEIVIPDTYNDLPITEIGYESFRGCEGITKVEFSDNIVSIAKSAFANCSGLVSVTISKNLISIGYDAFFNCVNLIDIQLPDSVTSIGQYAFYNTGYYNDESNWENGVLYLSNHLIDAQEDLSETYNVKIGTVSIAGSAFSYCTNILNIVIPNTVISIGGYAFYGCSNLASITIPDSVLKIDADAFYGCDSLADVFFLGTKSAWENISIGERNTGLENAKIHFAVAETPPTTPKLKSVSNAIDGVKVAWNAVDGADEYIIYRKTSKSGWANLGTTSEATFTDKTAKSGTTYYYTVKAQNGAGASGYNKTGLAIKYLSAPKLSKVYNNGAGNVLSWGKVTGASGYYVYRKTPSSGWSKVATIKKGTTASYTDKKVTYGKTYIYTVKAYSGKTTSSFNTNGVTILKKIPNVTITTKNVNGGKKVTLSSSISGATIYYKTSSKGSYKKYTGEFGLTSTKTIYAYAVRSGYYKSSTASKKITVTKVKTPSVVVKNCVGGKKISFTSGTAGATFYYKTSKNGSYVKYTEPFTLTSTKTVYVKAYKPGYATSSTASKKVSVSKIGTPTGLTVKSYASTSTKISWKKVSGAQGYFIYRATEKDGAYTLVHTIKSGTTVSKTDTGLEPTTTYYYKVRAYCSGKASSSYTAVAGAITKATPTTTDAKKFFNGLNGIWGGAYLKLFAKPGDKDFKYDTIYCMKYHTYDFYSNQTSYKSYLTLSSTGKKSTVKISSIMSEAEYKKYINRKNYDHWRVYKVSDLQAILDKTWAPGTFKVKDWADGKDHIVTSKGYFLMNMPDRGLDAADVVTEIKSCEKVDGKFYLEVYMLNYDFWGERIYDVSTGNYATVNGYGYELTSVEQFCADAGITKDQLGTVTVVIKETSSGLRLESMS